VARSPSCAPKPTSCPPARRFSLLSQPGPVGGADSFAAGLELLGRLSALQDASPVAVVVEDLHWATSRRARRCSRPRGGWTTTT
jgi:hypothetical protein